MPHERPDQPHGRVGRGVYAMILAAGQSRRMGEAKQLLPHGAGTMLDAVIDGVLESSVDGLLVVTTPGVAPSLVDCLPRACAVAINEDPASEMLVSAQIGLRALIEEFQPADEDGVLVLLGDQPQVRGGTITTCAEAYRLPRTPPGILIATYKERRAHPTVFRIGLIRQLLDWPPDRKLNELARENPHEVREAPITSAAMPLDVNTPEDYLRLRRESDSS